MRVLTPLLSAALIPLLMAPAMAAPRPSSIPLPVDFQPEGIAVGEGNTFYVGSLRDGDIYRGDLRSGEGARFVDTDEPGGRRDEGRPGPCTGSSSPAARPVMPGSTTPGTVSTVADLVLGAPSATFSNDVAITADALYFTDTLEPRIYKVPILSNGSFGTTQPITVSGPAAESSGFGLNGIDSTRDGRLIVNHTALGILAVSTRPPV